jgi:hypothetical protein
LLNAHSSIINNWNTNFKAEISVTKAIHELISRNVLKNEVQIPNLREAGDLLMFSDYGGDHKKSKYNSYSFFILPYYEAERLFEKIKFLRNKYFEEVRVINYKNLNDKVRLNALPEYLNAYNSTNGLLISFLVDKTNTKSIFLKNGLDLESKELEKFNYYSRSTFEKTLRIIHFICLISNGICNNNQRMFWISDEDEIIANAKKENELSQLLDGISKLYLNFSLKFGFASTKEDTAQQRLLEELCVIPDLLSGVLPQLQHHISVEPQFLHGKAVYPLDENLRMKDKILANWIAQASREINLKKHLFTIADFQNQLRVSKTSIKPIM